MPFKQIIGHEFQKGVLKRAIVSGNVAHAYIFYGPEGVGKRLVARALAQALNCEGNDPEGCGECVPCRKIEKGNHPDVLCIQSEDGYIKIDKIRLAQKIIGYKAYEGRWKVAVLDGCEDMRLPVANAFLKTLEEPPDRTTIILICHNHLSLLPTIQSRCQKIRFHPLQESQIQDILRIKAGMSPETASAMALMAGGSPGLALSMEFERIRELREMAFDLLFRGGGREVVDIFSRSKKATELKEEFKDLLVRMMTLARDMSIAEATGREEFIKNRDMIPELERADKRMKPGAMPVLFDATMETWVSLHHNANPQLAMDNLLLKISDHSVTKH